MKGCPFDEPTRREEQPHGLVGVRPFDASRVRPNSIDITVGQGTDHGLPTRGAGRQVAVAGTRAGVDD